MTTISTPIPPSPNLQHVASSIADAGPGQYGETQEQDGVQFVILNDEVLTSVANATTALVNGHSLERMAVLYQFPQFLEHCPHDSLHLMVPRICDVLVQDGPDVQMAAAEALYYVVNTRTPPHIAKDIVVATLAVIASDAQVDVFDGCGEILSMILPQVARDDVVQLVVPATRERAVSNRPESRRLAARIIGALEDAITPSEIDAMFFSHALNLANDQDDSVRAMMAQSLGPVAIKLPLRLAEQSFWPKLRVLLRDSNTRVRAAAMRAMAKSTQAHTDTAARSTFFKDVLKPLFLDECRTATAIASKDLRTVSDDTYLMLEIFAEVYGYFIYALHKLLGNNSKDWAICQAALKAMVNCNGPTVRHWCAFNMPAIATVTVKQNRHVVATVVQSLAADSDMETRATLAAGIKETVGLLVDGECRAEVIQAISMLFMDDSTQVRMNALQHLSELLKLLSPGEEVNLARARAAVKAEQRGSKVGNGELLQSTDGVNCEEADSVDRELRRLSKIFSSLEMMPFDSWRTQEILAEELRKAAHLVPQQMLCENVAPLLLQMARESTYLVRKASMRALMHVLRYIPDVRRRNHILKHLRTEWARGKVYWTRVAFIDGAEFALELVSTKLFNQLFKKELLRLSTDPVPNVKSRLLRLFSRLLQRWKPYPDFQEALRVLANDDDFQVSQEARDMMERLPTVGPLADQEAQEEKNRETREEKFFVHRPRRRKPEIASNATGAPKLRPSVPKTASIEKAPSITVTDHVKQPIEEQKGAPPPPTSQVDLKERRKAMVGQESPTAEPPRKPSFFKLLFGSCCG